MIGSFLSHYAQLCCRFKMIRISCICFSLSINHMRSNCAITFRESGLQRRKCMSVFYVVRHAHAKWIPDENRPLSEQGFQDARRIPESS